jgi:hypothetical protein
MDERIGKRKPANGEALLLRMRMSSPQPAQTLQKFSVDSGIATAMSPYLVSDSASPEEIYTRERAMVDTYRMIPLVWVPQVYGLSARVRNWTAPGPGETWPLADVWLDTPSETETKDNP